MTAWDRGRRHRGVTAVAASIAAVWALSETLHWRASRAHLPEPTGDGPPQGVPTVLVLGYPSRRSGLHPMQVWRTDIAVRSLEPGGLLLFSGGNRNGSRSEAEVMAEYAREVRMVPIAQALVETHAMSTWQNVSLSLAVLEHARTIKVASSPMHAARARAYLIKQRPELASRLRKADDYRFGEQPIWKTVTVAHYLSRYVHARIHRVHAQG